MSVGYRVLLFLAAMMVVAAAPGVAQEADPIHGNYAGAFTSGIEAGLRAEVVAISEKDKVREYKVNFFLLAPGAAEEQRIEVPRATVEGIVEDGSNEVRLADPLSGRFTITGALGEGLLRGTFTSEDRTAPYELRRIVKSPPTLGLAPPPGARALFDGSSFDHWVRTPEHWCLQGDGSMEICSSSLQTREEFGDAEWHIEFRTPFMPNDRGQARGNSGVYVQGRYEVQVLDSFGEPAAWDYCGGIYKVAVPRKNASLPPGEWQTYDITFRAPRFDDEGNKTENARITVVHNGETIHENLELPNVTPGGVSDKEAARGVLMLQDHNDSVRFRNIWVKPLG